MLLIKWLMLISCLLSLSEANAEKVKAVVFAARVHKVSVKEISLDKIEILAKSSGISTQRVQQYAALGMTIFFNPNSPIVAETCSEAVIVLEASAGNFLPNEGPHEVYRSPSILGLTCINK